MKFNVLWKGACQLAWAMGMWLMAFSMGIWAQTATVTGTVVDAEARYPLLGATVQVLTSPEHVTTADFLRATKIVQYHTCSTTNSSQNNRDSQDVSY